MKLVGSVYRREVVVIVRSVGGRAGAGGLAVTEPWFW